MNNLFKICCLYLNAQISNVMMFQVKCEKYWPEFGQEVTHGAVTIMNTSNQVFADYTFRQLNVSFKGKTRKVNVKKLLLNVKTFLNSI